VYDPRIIGMRCVGTTSPTLTSPGADDRETVALPPAKEESAMTVSSLSNALRHRRQAAACGLFAANAQSTVDRELLLRMQRSLLGHACYEDWVNGLPPVPPARPAALPVPGRARS
jgi:hypothetical protein